MALLAATPPHVCRLITSMRGSMSAVLHAPFTYHYPLSIAHLSLWSTELGIYKELRPLHYTCSLAFKGEKNVQNVPIQRDCVPFNNTHYFSAQYLHKAYSTQKYKKYIMVTTYYPCIVKSLCKVSIMYAILRYPADMLWTSPTIWGPTLHRRTQEAGGGALSYHGDPHQAGTGEVSNQRQLAIIWQWEPPASCLSAERIPEPCIAKPYRSARWKGQWLGSLTEHPPVLAFMELCTHNALLPNTLVPCVKISILYSL